MAVREAEPVGSLQEVTDAGLDREDLLGIYRNMLITRGIEERGHILYKQGKIPGSFYTGRGNEGVGRRGRDRDGAGRRRHAAPARHGRPHHARRRAVADLRAVHGPRRRAHARPRRQRPHRRRRGSGCIAMVSHLPAMLPVARRHGARLPHPRGAARRASRWCGDGAAARGDAHEGDEPRRRAPAAGRLRDRQQPVGLLDADAPRVTPSSTSPTAPRPTASRASSSTAPTCSPSTARRSARSRRRAQGGGPTLIECVTLRMEGHAVHDDAFYVPKELFEEWARARSDRALPHAGCASTPT